MASVNLVNMFIKGCVSDGIFSKDLARSVGLADLLRAMEREGCLAAADFEIFKLLGSDVEVDKVSFLPKERLYSQSEVNDALEALNEVSKCGEFTSGKKSVEFEALLSERFGGKGVTLCNSGTSALSIALMSVGVKPGDEVITQANSFAATENAIFAIGAIPVFVDVDKDYGINPQSLAAQITSKTKAILPVHLYGRLSRMKEIKKIADGFDIPVVEDACQAFGLEEVGEYSSAAALSFNPYKNFGVFGKAGAIVSNDDRAINRTKELAYHGFKIGCKNEKEISWGLNAQMDNVQSSIAIKKIRYFELNQARRALLAMRYIDQLSGVELIEYLPDFISSNTWHLFPIRMRSKDSVQMVRDRMSKKWGVQTDIYYPILSADNIKGDVDFRCGDISATRDIHSRTFHLPLYQNLTFGEQDRVIKALTDVVRGL